MSSRDRASHNEDFNLLIGLPQLREAEAAYDEFARELVDEVIEDEAK
ncbi:MAG: hypothetical protein ACREEE_03440 [Dongiaceae bacterium]